MPPRRSEAAITPELHGYGCGCIARLPPRSPRRCSEGTGRAAPSARGDKAGEPGLASRKPLHRSVRADSRRSRSPIVHASPAMPQRANTAMTQHHPMTPRSWKGGTSLWTLASALRRARPRAAALSQRGTRAVRRPLLPAESSGRGSLRSCPSRDDGEAQRSHDPPHRGSDRVWSACCLDVRVGVRRLPAASWRVSASSPAGSPRWTSPTAASQTSSGVQCPASATRQTRYSARIGLNRCSVSEATAQWPGATRVDRGDSRVRSASPRRGHVRAVARSCRSTLFAADDAGISR